MNENDNKMKHFTLILLVLIGINCQAQDNEKFNFGFEDYEEGQELPQGWEKYGNLEVSISKTAHSGKISGKISSFEGSDGSGNGTLAYKIPANYEGDEIRFEGYVKIESVKNGFAGLFLRVDGVGKPIAFDNMEDENINGTSDWKKYSISLDFPENAKYLLLGGILSGDGTVWFDDFTLSIDGEDIQNLKEIKQKEVKAKLDKEFDEGSKIEIKDLDTTTIKNLELLGKIWGFLKYHHPEIAKGNYNWDYELFRFLPDYLNVTNPNERDNLLIDWIDSLGQIKKCTECEPTPDDAFIKPDMQWIRNQNETLASKLMSVYEGRNSGNHYYVTLASVGKPEFTNENDYSDMKYPDDGFRLLSLFRYWNMINYYFPYKYLTDKNWSGVLKEYIPDFINASDELEYELASLRLIADVRDTHANLYGRGADQIRKWKGMNFPAVNVRFIEDQLVVTDYFNPEYKEDYQLEIGDIITEINGKNVQKIIDEISEFYPASNQPTRLRNISSDILRSNDTTLNIDYVSKNSGKAIERNNTIKLFPRDSLNIYRWLKPSKEPSFKMLEDNIGYVTLQTIENEDLPKIKEDFADTKGIIIDIRNYPSEQIFINLGSYFVSEPTPFVKFTKGNINNPGEFTLSDSFNLPPKKTAYSGKLIVLVNEITQSQAELTAMALRAGENTTIIGSTTAGADGNVSRFKLPGNLITMISGIGIYYPDGEETQRVGIVPDIEVKQTIEGIRKEKDELLEEAIRLILND